MTFTITILQLLQKTNTVFSLSLSGSSLSFLACCAQQDVTHWCTKTNARCNPLMASLAALLSAREDQPDCLVRFLGASLRMSQCSCLRGSHQSFELSASRTHTGRLAIGGAMLPPVERSGSACVPVDVTQGQISGLLLLLLLQDPRICV